MTLPTAEFWRGKRVFLTGHTGFKGGWLALWLAGMGTRVYGYALAPSTDPNLFAVARVGEIVARSTLADIRDKDGVAQALRAAEPDIVIHMAAQPLVRASYAAPVDTFATNVMGTVHVLDAARRTGSIKAVVVVSSDKCYENRESGQAYRETDPVGGHDPYSASKGAAELATSAYRRSFFGGERGAAAVASARAGNVVGGGDWSEDRLVPDFLRAAARRETMIARHPASVRPWQHVLEPLAGYLLLAEYLVRDGAAFAGAWNFGPDKADAWPVSAVLDRLAKYWGDGASWRPGNGEGPHEAQLLHLDSTKARQSLGWRPRWTLDQALQRTVAWAKAKQADADMAARATADIADYLSTPA